MILKVLNLLLLICKLDLSLSIFGQQLLADVVVGGLYAAEEGDGARGVLLVPHLG